MTPVNARHHPHGIVTLDAEYLRPGLAAIHLIVERGRAAIVDTGTNAAVPHTLAALAGLGVAPEAVDFVIVTHVHLDHAGAAGAFLAACPNAKLVAHPRGARHLIDPSKLVRGSIAVYGEAVFHALYGEIVPAPVERVIEADDGFVLDFNGRRLEFIDTPGHARHHFCIHDLASNSLFTGDTFGISYREFDVDGRPFIFPTTTPVQFEPDALHASIDRLIARNAAAAYLTHYGRIENLPALAPDLHALIDEFVALALAAPGAGAARQDGLKLALGDLLMARLRAHGCGLDESTCRDLLANDVELNSQGLLDWRDRAPR
ncbi:MAG: MBL fold metallo-hydrolase [Hydrogenophilales bacterium 28-61-23]|nr:MAG: MBL fold metallo-hydrolase [Hydrogenophilales bacterium 28-61-23]